MRVISFPDTEMALDGSWSFTTWRTRTYSSYKYCWWPADARTPIISSYGADLVLPDHKGVSNSRVNPPFPSIAMAWQWCQSNLVRVKASCLATLFITIDWNILITFSFLNGQNIFQGLVSCHICKGVTTSNIQENFKNTPIKGVVHDQIMLVPQLCLHVHISICI